MLPITVALEALGEKMDAMNANLTTLNANMTALQGMLDPKALTDLKTIMHDIAALLRKIFPEAIPNGLDTDGTTPQEGV